MRLTWVQPDCCASISYHVVSGNHLVWCKLGQVRLASPISNRVIAADQMIRNSSMTIGEVDSGSAKLLAAHSKLAEPKSTSPIFMLEFLIIWSAVITRLEIG